MAAESILTYLKPNFPGDSTGDDGVRYDLEYIGPAATLIAARPANGATWGNYLGTVESTAYNPISGTTPAQGELRVTVSKKLDSPEGTGTATEIAYDIRWERVPMSLVDHPRFLPAFAGGAHPQALTADDLEDIEQWKNEKNVDRKNEYKFSVYYNQGASTYHRELSATAKLYVCGIKMGVETWEEYAPVARKTTTYVGGPPATSTAGLKEQPQGFPNLPQGYQWRKSADDSGRAGGQTRWDRVEEWEGAIKVLLDRKEIFWTVP